MLPFFIVQILLLLSSSALYILLFCIILNTLMMDSSLISVSPGVLLLVVPLRDTYIISLKKGQYNLMHLYLYMIVSRIIFHNIRRLQCGFPEGHFSTVFINCYCLCYICLCLNIFKYV